MAEGRSLRIGVDFTQYIESLGRLHCPQNAILDNPVQHGIRIVFFVVPQRHVELPAAIELVKPRQRQGIGKAGGVDLHGFKRSQLFAVGHQHWVYVGVQVIDKIAFVCPFKLRRQILDGREVRIGYLHREGLHLRVRRKSAATLLEAALRAASPKKRFTGARVLVAEQRLIVIPGSNWPVFLETQPGDNTAVELQLDAAHAASVTGLRSGVLPPAPAASDRKSVV